jgi:hypothetical protein
MGGQGFVVAFEKINNKIKVQGLQDLAIKSYSYGWKVWLK